MGILIQFVVAVKSLKSELLEGRRFLVRGEHSKVHGLSARLPPSASAGTSSALVFNEHESRAHEATETAAIMSAESSIGVGRVKRLSHDNVVTWHSRKGLGRLRRAGCFAV